MQSSFSAVGRDHQLLCGANWDIDRIALCETTSLIALLPDAAMRGASDQIRDSSIGGTGRVWPIVR